MVSKQEISERIDVDEDRFGVGAADPGRQSAAGRHRIATAFARLVGFTGVSIVLAFPEPSRFRTRIPGNPGDAFLIMSLLKWGGDRATHLYSGYWNGPMYASDNGSMAYTDTFLPLTPPFRVIEWLTGSPVIAFNLIYLAGWVLTAECTYHLLVRMSRSRPASVVGSLAFTFCTLRLAQTGHYQLVFAFGIPLTLLLLFKLVARPSYVGGLLLGSAMAVQFLTTVYFGVIVIVGAGLALVVAILCAAPRRRLLLSSLAALVPLVVFVLPVAAQYQRVADESGQRKTYPAGFALRPGDLRTAAPLSNLSRHVSLFRNDSSMRSSENFAYVGFFVVVFVAVLVVWLGVRAARRRPLGGGNRFELLTVFAVGLFAFLIAIGRGPFLGVHSPAYDMFRHVVPGVESMLALVRLFVFTQLTLVVLATIALAAALRRISGRALRVSLAAVLALLVVVEARARVPMVRFVEPAPGSVDALVREMPAGPSVQWPMAPRTAGPAYAYLEATRMLLNMGAAQQSVNGYSGFAPAGYDADVTVINTLPSAEGVARLRDLGVRYLVIHTAPVDTGLQTVTELVNDSGFAYVDPERAEAVVDALPTYLVEDVVRASDGLAVVLRE